MRNKLDTEWDDELTALCGYVTRAQWNKRRNLFYEGAENERFVSCPICNKKAAAARLKARPAGAPVLTMEQDKTAKGHFRYQGGWKALQDGVLIAYLGFEDHAWRVYPLYLGHHDGETREQDRGLVGTPLNDDGEDGRRDHYYRLYAARYKSKEAALLAAGEFRAGGFLKTEVELFAARAEALKANRAWADERQRKFDEREQTRNDTLLALKEIFERESLSNFQRQGLMTAIAKFEKPTDKHSLDDEV